MTLSLPKYRSFSAIGLALVWTTLTFGAAISPASVEARTLTPYYSAEFAAPAAKDGAIIGGVAWQCAGTKCIAAKASSRPVMICKRVVRELGAVTNFTAGEKALEAADIAACNGQ